MVWLFFIFLSLVDCLNNALNDIPKVNLYLLNNVMMNIVHCQFMFSFMMNILWADYRYPTLNAILSVKTSCPSIAFVHHWLMSFLLLILSLQIFFNPEIYSDEFTTPLPSVVDKCIQSAPIDTRRALYKVNMLRNIVVLEG